jgi:hypothetical protein
MYQEIKQELAWLQKQAESVGLHWEQTYSDAYVAVYDPHHSKKTQEEVTKEIEALIAPQIKAAGGYYEYVVTEEDLATNPVLEELGTTEAEVIEVPATAVVLPTLPEDPIEADQS